MKKSFYLSGLLALCFVFSSAVVMAAVRPTVTSDPHDSTVCSGAHATFTVAAVDTPGPILMHYKWQVSTNSGGTWTLVSGAVYTGDTTATLNVHANNSLNGNLYRSIVTNTSGADTSAAAMLTVDTAFNTISGPASICISQPATYTALVSGGIWSLTDTDSASVVAGTGVVTGLLDGTDSLIYTVTNSCATITTAKVITIHALPNIGAIIGIDSVCKASTITLSDTTSGGVWSTTTPLVTTVNASGVVTGVNRGSGNIVYTTSNTFCSTSVSHAVRVDTTVVGLPVSGPAATCRGGSITLTNPNVIGGHVWTASNGNATVSSAGVVTGVAYGTVNITYNFSNACNSVSTFKNIQVDTLLPHGTISGATDVCAGSFIHLTPSLAGGSWLSDASSIAVVDPSGNVTGVSQGSTVISYYFSNACGSSVATHPIGVAVPAAAITGGDSVGVGASHVLGNISTMGAGLWSVADTNIATINSTSGNVTGVHTGTTTVTFTVFNACGTTSATIILHVGNAPSAGTIKGADSVCVGANITLSDAVTGGVWSASNSKVSVDPNTGVVTGIMPTYDSSTAGGHFASGLAIGRDTIYYTVSNAFGTTRVMKVLFVNHTPQVTLTGPNLVTTGGNYFFRGIPYGGQFFQSNTTFGYFISFSDSVHLVSYGSFIVLHPEGKDTITYRYTNSCGTVDSIFVARNPLAVGSVNNQTAFLNVYPNPNQGTFTLNLVSAITENVVVTVTNTVGAKVKEFTVTTNSANHIDLDQPAGLYVITATTSGGVKYNAKITVTR